MFTCRPYDRFQTCACTQLHSAEIREEPSDAVGDETGRACVSQAGHRETVAPAALCGIS